MDLTFKTDYGYFNYRVGGIIINDNKILMVKNSNNDYYYSVGGRVKFGETARCAIVREAKEETGLDFEIERLAFIHENFFVEESKGNYHELAFFYLLKPLEDLSKIKCESTTENGISETLEWLDIDSLEKYKLFPSFYKTELKKLSDHIIEWVDRQ